MYSGKRGYLYNAQLEWHNGYYDGPISGVASIDGYKVYFKQFDEHWIKYYDPESDIPEYNDEEEPGREYVINRTYYAYDISEDAMKLLEQNQMLWEQHVSNGNRYYKNRRLFLTDKHVVGTGTWDSYHAACAKIDLSKELVFKNTIGYFDGNALWR